MIFSTKLVTAGASYVLTFGITFAVAKLGLHVSPGAAEVIPQLISLAAAGFAGWFVKEEGSLSPTLAHVEAKVQALYDSLPAPARQVAQAVAKDVEGDPEVQSAVATIKAKVDAERLALQARLAELNAQSNAVAAPVAPVATEAPEPPAPAAP